MPRRLMVLFSVIAMALGGVLAVAGPAAAARTQCAKGSGTHSGRCYTVGHVNHVVKVVEAVPLQNRSNHTVHAHCSFTQTITRAQETSQEVSAGVKADLFSFVSADTSYHLTKKVSQTASQATTAGGSVTLKPGQHVTCERTYGYVTTIVKVYEYSGTRGKHYSVSTRIPSYLGARFVN